MTDILGFFVFLGLASWFLLWEIPYLGALVAYMWLGRITENYPS